MSAQVEELKKQLGAAREEEEKLQTELEKTRSNMKNLEVKLNETSSKAKEEENSRKNDGDGEQQQEDVAVEESTEADHEGDVAKKVDGWKALGNKAFTAQDYNEAIKHYTRCIKALDNAELEPVAAILGNRCACYLALKRFVPASWDAQCAVRADPTWWKGYWRHGVALMGMSPKNERSEMAVKAFESCSKCEGLPEDKKKDVEEALSRARVRLQEGRDKTPLPQQCQQQ